jgi:Uma2 family endonuclease
MALQPKPKSVCLTEEEYLNTELASEVKREYLDGHAYAMTGASEDHGRIAMNIAGEFRNHLKGTPCEAFIADMKVHLGKDYVYPDVIVDCRDAAADKYLAQSPSIIVEVLSTSTRKLDLTTKLLRYINLPSLQEYILIEQDFVSVQILRKSNQWIPSYYFLGDTVTFESIGLALTVEEIYDRVENAEMEEFRQKIQAKAPPTDLGKS